LPKEARTKQTPPGWKAFLAWITAPVLAGGVAVHCCDEADARQVLSLSLNYGAALLTLQAAVGWGLAANGFAIPRVSEYRPLIQFLRMGPPCMAPMISLFISMMVVSFPRDAVQFLFAGHLTVWCCEALQHRYALVPPWYFRIRSGQVSLVLLGTSLLFFSEQLQFEGSRSWAFGENL
jgi:hypothetical protein